VITDTPNNEIAFLMENPDVLVQRIAALDRAVRALREIDGILSYENRAAVIARAALAEIGESE
jgi:hypothetical protein